MRIKSVPFFLLGGTIVAAAFFAEVIGLDNDPGWGKGRFAILVFGILVLAWGIFNSLYTNAAAAISRKMQSIASQSLTNLLELFQRYWYTFPILVFVILVYIWFASSGSWTHWHSATRYYADLAGGFRQGHLYVLSEPNSKLLSLPNPYDPLTRQGVNFYVDYSLYNGKYYLYWGPVPALILVALSPFTRGRVGDLSLVFGFVCGIFILQSVFILMVWNRFFRDLPKWILALSVFVLGLITPWTYILVNQPNGRIYEAAISGAQFFLMAGLLTMLIAFSKPVPSSLFLALTGFLWALAIATRVVLVVPIGFMILMVIYRIWKTYGSKLESLSVKLISLGTPLVLAVAGLGWYNWSRFGSVTETGFSYALAGPDLQNYPNGLFSPIYILGNLYSYILQPPAAMAEFPFLYPREISPVIGLLVVAPFTIFAVIAIVLFFRKANGKSEINSAEQDNNSLLNWIIANLLGSFFSAFCVSLMFFWIAVRYLGDFMPELAMVSAFGFWQGYRLLAQQPNQQRIFSILGVILAFISIIMSILLSISVKYLGRTGL